MHVYVCMHICICMGHGGRAGSRPAMYRQICICRHVHIHVYKCICIGRCMYRYEYTYVYMSGVHAHMNMCVCVLCVCVVRVSVLCVNMRTQIIQHTRAHTRRNKPMIPEPKHIHTKKTPVYTPPSPPHIAGHGTIFLHPPRLGPLSQAHSSLRCHAPPCWCECGGGGR